ncbi:thiol:disulfide interchange protein DsbA/DsbL [Massilia sp. DWR3-1-1]|uniref:thiol:disulfide interchange protein DsbA/DsbL n=1 Tax=Massilia sp. DWR3-1-1 TaxID=2804559 RepID=UPI003CFABE9F
MPSLRILVAALGLAAATAFASPADPKLGVDYVQLASPQAAQVVGKKVEVIEFFMYHCPHCYVLEPTLAEWVKKNADKVIFKRVHMPFRGATDPEAHLYLTLEALGKLEELHPKAFKAMHVERVNLANEQVAQDWAVKNGVDKAKFLDAWNSFGVMTKLKRLPATLAAYKVESVPTLIIDGRLMTSPAVVDAGNKGMNEAALSKATIEVLDNLVKKVAATK